MNIENQNLQKYLEAYQTADYKTCKGVLKFAFEDMLRIFNQDIQKALHLSHLAAKLGTSFHTNANESEKKLYFDFFNEFENDLFANEQYAIASQIKASDIWYVKETCKDNNDLKKLMLDMIMAFAAVDDVIEVELIEKIALNLEETILNNKYDSLAKAKMLTNLIFNCIPKN